MNTHTIHNTNTINLYSKNFKSLIRAVCALHISIFNLKAIANRSEKPLLECHPSILCLNCLTTFTWLSMQNIVKYLGFMAHDVKRIWAKAKKWTETKIEVLSLD